MMPLMSWRLPVLLVCGVTAAVAGPPPVAAASEKKGVAISRRADDPGARTAALNVDWYYNWGIEPFPGVDADFVPMVWGVGRSFRERLDKLEAGEPPAVLLGFNEPDHDNQSDMTVEEAVEAWDELEAISDTLVSPAPVRPLGDWMRGFMDEAEERGLDVDYVAVHWYGGPRPERFLAMLDETYAAYGKPIWVTEFAVADWSTRQEGRTNRHSPQTVLCFMAAVLPELEARDHVMRYAWYASPPREANRTSALFDADGALTDLGRFYAAFGTDDPPEPPTDCPAR